MKDAASKISWVYKENSLLQLESKCIFEFGNNLINFPTSEVQISLKESKKKKKIKSY